MDLENRVTESKRLELRVANLDCDADAAKIKRALDGMPGVEELTVYPRAAKVAIRYDASAASPDAFHDALRALGFPAQVGRVARQIAPPWKNAKVLTSVASGTLLLFGWLLGYVGMGAAAARPLAPQSWGIAGVVYVISLIVGAYYFGKEAIEELIFERAVGIELLMAVAAIVATIMGAPAEGAMLAFLYSISEAAEGYTEEKTRSAVRALMDLAPKTALVLRRQDGVVQEVTIPVEEVVQRDVFVVKPGQSIATDGEILQGKSSVNQAPVTGESVPVEKTPGDTVFAGTINGEGSLEVRATKAFAENTIARIIHMVEEAQERKGQSERFIERFGKRYSPAVLGLGILIAIAGPYVTSGSWVTWITRATVFIVAAAPCALVISIPITLVAALGTGARKGVLIKGGVYVEELSRVTVVALDKTGTITRGVPDVTDFVEVGDQPAGSSADAILALAAGIEARSQHPLAQAILRYAEQRAVLPATVSDFRSLTGAGAVGNVEGELFYVGSPSLFERELGVSLTAVSGEIARLQAEGKTVVVAGDGRQARALFAVRDNVRDNAARAIRALHDVGIRKVVMLTGDNERTAAVIAREVGIDEVHADLKPEDKVARVRELADRFGHVAMVGDGVNDAPALAKASVGIAMGAAGTDVALETADVALMADDLEKLVDAFRLAKRNQHIVRQNLALSVVVVGALVVGALAGVFTLPTAVIAHELSEFIVIANGLRMLRA